MYYWSINNEGKSDDKRISTIKMNISRFIRDEVPGEEIAEFIPFLHLQSPFSFTCAYNACSALMYSLSDKIQA
jgi:hypothetical protein